MHDSTKSVKIGGRHVMFGLPATAEEARGVPGKDITSLLLTNLFAKTANNSNSQRDYKDCAVYADLFPSGISLRTNNFSIFLVVHREDHLGLQRCARLQTACIQTDTSEKRLFTLSRAYVVKRKRVQSVTSAARDEFHVTT